MRLDKLIEIFEEVDISENAHYFQHIHSHYFDELFYHNRNVLGFDFEFEIRVEGRFFRDSFLIDNISLIESKLWLNDKETYNITNNQIIRFKKIIKRKIKELV